MSDQQAKTFPFGMILHVSSKGQMSLARKFGKPFTSTDGGITVKGYIYGGRVYITAEQDERLIAAKRRAK